MKSLVQTLGKTEALTEKSGSLTARAYLFFANLSLFARGTKPYVTITAAYTLDNIDYLVSCSGGPYTVTLPSAVGIEGREYEIKNTTAGVITVACFGAQTIDGSATFGLNLYDALKVVSNGSNWEII